MRTARAIVCRAFDLGITHFDLANNYGAAPRRGGGGGETFGRILRSEDLRKWRDELIISTKAGYYMWPGPYGEWGSRKYLLSSLDQSLANGWAWTMWTFFIRIGQTRTRRWKKQWARSRKRFAAGKALYAGISNYEPAEDRGLAAKTLRELGTPCLHPSTALQYVGSPD